MIFNHADYLLELIFGDCLEKMQEIPDNSVDFILTDPPYGTSKCKWDVIIPFEPMWKELIRISKDNTCICLFGTEPFSSLLRTSNLKMFKYDWIWRKDKATNHLNVKKQPMRRIEIISVFYGKQCLYKPQMVKKNPKNIRKQTPLRKQIEIYGKMTNSTERQIPLEMGYPSETLSFRSCSADKGKSFHPTQKPVDLLEYLIKTYSNEGDTVLDFTAGSFSTGIACINTKRNFIGIENDDKHFNTGKERIEKTLYKSED